MILEVKGIHSFKLLPTFRKIQRIQVMFDDPLRQVSASARSWLRPFFPSGWGTEVQRDHHDEQLGNSLVFFPYPQFSYPQQESEKQVCDRSQSDAK